MLSCYFSDQPYVIVSPAEAVQTFCSVDIVYPSLSSSVDIPLISADNASCWFSYNLFAGTDGELPVSYFLLQSHTFGALTVTSILSSASYSLARCTW